jgi:hypothetical protein
MGGGGRTEYRVQITEFRVRITGDGGGGRREYRVQSTDYRGWRGF